MNALKKLGSGLAILIIGILLMGLFLSEDFSMERSIVINAPAEKVFAQVNDLKNWPNWSPWNKMDPNMKMNYSSNTIGANAWYSWESKEDNVGKGKLSILESQANTLMKTKIEFEGFDSPGYGHWKLEPEGSGTKVTWGFSGKADNYLGRYMGVMMPMMMGSIFEQGLRDLKKISEGKV
ncbi:MAG: SRPBCC family protein [Flammeovirgaceae bacterium]